MLGLSSSKVMRDVANNRFSYGNKRQAPLSVVIVPICFVSILYFIVQLVPKDETDESSEMRCEGALEVDAISLECLEVQLFRSWRRVEVDGPGFNETVENLERIAQEKLLVHMNSISDIELGEAAPLVSFGNEAETNQTFNNTMQGVDNHSSITPVARRLVDTRADIQARMDRLYSESQKRHQAFEEAAQKRHQAFQEKFDKLEHDAQEAMNKPRQESDFSKQLKAMMADFEARKAKLSSTRLAKAEARKARLDKIFNNTYAAIKDKSHTNDYADHLKAIQDHFDALQQRSPKHRLPVHHVHHNSSEELATHIAEFKADQEKLSHDHQEWQEGFNANAADYLIHLCAEEPRRSYPVCAKFVAREANKASKGEVSSEAPKAMSKFLAKGDGLSWAGLIFSLKQGSDSKNLDKGLIAVERSQLRSQKWQGKLPTVACIVAIPSGSSAEAQIKHVIENFRLQSYEGQRQLVILYKAPSPTTPSSLDSEVEALVRKHADGTLIKGVAARSHGEFPSTTSLRYAAWETDADIIARWNFDEWYHADRLSMQVRALALTSRPVSLLKSWTVLGSENASSAMLLSDNIGWESSIVGEAAWMKSHWMPLLHHERQVLGGTQAHSVAQVDMPELSTYIMDAGSWQGALSHFGLANHAALSSGVPKACLQAFGTGAHHVHVKSEIVDKVDFELAETYHGLAINHADVDEKLRLLCDEVSATKEPLQRDMLVAQVEQIAAVQKQLAGHSQTLKDILHDTDFESEPDVEH
jgi:hypothetical protein